MASLPEASLACSVATKLSTVRLTLHLSLHVLPKQTCASATKLTTLATGPMLQTTAT